MSLTTIPFPKPHTLGRRKAPLASVPPVILSPESPEPTSNFTVPFVPPGKKLKICYFAASGPHPWKAGDHQRMIEGEDGATFVFEFVDA